ncbi:ATP-binding protein [Maridesulfovibrio sp.]|uniref:ATP-binding protein n=1 Tax=Maridesulfovibrio sp. TaxID=2795000 RepID=UPI002A18B978|nr:ATP-binding protein [Maridesulfovibrio sp.]
MTNNASFSIKTKLFAAVCLSAALCVSLPLGFAYYILKADLAADTRMMAQEKLELARRIYFKSDSEKPALRIAEVSRLLGREMAYVSQGGQITSPSARSEEPWHADSSELRQAKADGLGFEIRENPGYDHRTLYAAIRLGDVQGRDSGFLVMKESLAGLGERMGTIRKVFFWALPIVALVCYAVIRFVTLHLSTSVESMVRTAEAVGQGNYKRRIRNFPDKEFIPLAEAINWMAERIDEHVGIITSQKNKLQAVLNGMWDGVMVMDGNCRIQSVNRALQEIFPGVQNGIGRNPLEVIPCPDLQDSCRELTDPEGPDARTVQLKLQDGRVYDINIVRSPHTVEPGQGPGAIAVFHDISKIKRLETVRRDFVANVSHELRTPLTSIKGYAETLLSSPPPPGSIRNSFLGTIEKNANHMCKIVDDLLNLSRLEGGRDISKFIYTDPAETLKNAWQACSALAEQRNVQMVTDLEPEHFTVHADPDQLMQLFRNLLENAIKYGPEDKPVAVEHAVEGEMLKVIVRDEGLGIPAADQPRIFERFYSVEKFRRNEFGSTGLGLAISRHIVSNHGGTISVQSPPEGIQKGTAFIFTIPLVEDSGDLSV